MTRFVKVISDVSQLAFGVSAGYSALEIFHHFYSGESISIVPFPIMLVSFVICVRIERKQ